MFLLKEEAEKPHRLDTVVFHGGMDGIRHTISALESKLPEPLLKQIKATFAELSARPVNQIAATKLYRSHIAEFVRFPVHHTPSQVKDFILAVEKKLNHNILVAKRGDTRTKRLREKTHVLVFYKNYKDQLKLMFDLQNLFLQAKAILDA